MKSYILTKWQQQLIPNIGTVVVVAFLLFAYTAWAAPSAQTSVPGVITYQGALTDDAGQPINSSVDLTFRLYSVSSGGTALWTETHSAVSVEEGLFRVGLGSQTPIPATVWDNAPLYLGIQVGSEPEMLPREELGAVPFAMQALTVPDGSIAFAKLDSTPWADASLATGFYSPLDEFRQKAQYRRVGDIVYLRGIITQSSGYISDDTLIMTLPDGFRPAKHRAFVAEPYQWLSTKHRVDIQPDGKVLVKLSADATPHVSLDGIFFSVSQ